MKDFKNPPMTGELIDKVRSCLDNLEKFRLDIEAALSYSNYSHTFDDIVGMVLTEQVAFFPMEKSFLITEFHVMPQYKTYHVFLAGGDLDEIKATQPWLEETAKANGCKYLSLTGRRGWERSLKDQGWRLQYITLYKEVD